MLDLNVNSSYYSVNGERFYNKLYAVKRAAELNTIPRWSFFENAFDSIDVTTLGKVSLTELYRQRALQLRDSYDYLILHYSGGSDSWNILNTFLKNNIKLDCVLVSRPKRMTDKNLYTPNVHDITGYNMSSEWDIVIKKDLTWLAAHYPNIKIEISDWTEALIESERNMDDVMSSITTQTPLNCIFKNQQVCYSEQEQLSLGKSVARIYGIDKPKLATKDNVCYYYFMDVSFSTLSESAANPQGTEYFYSTPKFPILAAEQAYAVFSYYKAAAERRHLLLDSAGRQSRDWAGLSTSQIYESIYQAESAIRPILYPEWDMTRFQATKSIPTPGLLPGVHQTDSFLTAVPEYVAASRRWEANWKAMFTAADRSNTSLFIDETRLKAIGSGFHFLAKID